MKTIHIDVSKIHDWQSFFEIFASAFGFPVFNDRIVSGMNGWIDCMTNLDEQFSEVQVAPGELICVALDHADVFKQNCPEQYEAFVESAAFVNWRRMDIGQPPILVVSFNV